MRNTFEPARYVYVVEAENGLIKIGSSNNPERRAETITTHSPVVVRLIAVLSGDRRDEFRFHGRFVKYRRHNEWFAAEGEVAAWVETIRGVGVEGIPEWDSLRIAGALNRKQIANKARGASARERWQNPAYRRDRTVNHRYQFAIRKLHGSGKAVPKDLLARLYAEYDANPPPIRRFSLSISTSENQG